MEYRVYIPSREVEIAGVVTEPSLNCEAIKRGAGRFKNRAIPPVPILDVRQMNKVSSDGTKKSSNSYHLTFSGSALPDYLVIGKLWLPVRLYVPTVMHCDRCQQIGHTAAFCCNKARCGKCGEQHVEGPCTTDPKCTSCGEAPHDLTACPKFIEREKHQIRSLQQRSRRTYAEMLKKLAPPAPPPDPNNLNNNLFAPLSDDDHGSDSEEGEGYTVVQTGSKRKRAVRRKRQLATKVQQEIPLTLNKSRSGGQTKKETSPGFKPLTGDFPPLPGPSKTPDDRVFKFKSKQTRPQKQVEQKQVSEKMAFSEIVDIIFNLLNVSPATRSLVKTALTFLKPLLKQLASNWPILESFISFDG